MNKKDIDCSRPFNKKMPDHTEDIECPMMVDQEACKNIEGFVDKCNSFNDGWVWYIPNCKHQKNKDECWKRFRQV